MGVFLKLRRLSKLGRGEEGSAAVEFALCLFPLLLIVGGILDYGHLWYMQSVLTTASREGARYATRYQTNPTTGARLTPNALSPLVTDYITSHYAGLLPSDAKLSVTPGGAGYTTGTTGSQVSIQVSAAKSWLLLSYLIPGTTNPQPLSSTTVMTCE
jgi:Flp pilus assembly protein TadG